MTVRKASEYIKTSVSTLNKGHLVGGTLAIPFVKMGKSVRYRRSDLDAFAAGCVRTSTSAQGSEPKAA
jgi:hypothetical protein